MTTQSKSVRQELALAARMAYISWTTKPPVGFTHSQLLTALSAALARDKQEPDLTPLYEDLLRAAREWSDYGEHGETHYASLLHHAIAQMSHVQLPEYGGEEKA